jgi:hypothetical protein
MKITKTQLKQIIKEELEAALEEETKIVTTSTGRESRLQNWCVGYKVDGKIKYRSVPADAAGVAETKVAEWYFRETDKHLPDKDIVSSKEGKC